MIVEGANVANILLDANSPLVNRICRWRPPTAAAAAYRFTGDDERGRVAIIGESYISNAALVRNETPSHLVRPDRLSVPVLAVLKRVRIELHREVGFDGNKR